MNTRDPFRSACKRLESTVPAPIRRALHWLREPGAKVRAVRLPVSLLCIAGSFFSYLPVLGLELFPIGLLLLAQDVKVLRRPAGGLTLWLLDRYEGALRAVRERHARWNAWCACVGNRHAAQGDTTLRTARALDSAD